MTPARLPENETERVRALHDLAILDTVEEARFDRLTRIAARLFDVPIALVSLVDTDRQWFKSHHGLDTCETSRDASFCAHAILEADPLVVPDALLDARFHDNPLVAGDPHIRFYAGHPIRTPTGESVGTFCLIDRAPREFTAADRAMLADLASMVERELALVVEATQDPLTRLYNRRGLQEVAQHMLALCSRSSGVASLLSIDLDGFKSINDAHGHEAGDRVLQWFASHLLKTFRRSDVIARMGGDEFCVLAPQITEIGLQGSLERLRSTFQDSPMARRYPGLSWSCGVREFECQSATNFDEVLRMADEQMYVAKEQSRRRRGEPASGAQR